MRRFAEESDELGVSADRGGSLGGVEGRREDRAENGEARGVFGAHGGLEVAFHFVEERRGRGFVGVESGGRSLHEVDPGRCCRWSAQHALERGWVGESESHFYCVFLENLPISCQFGRLVAGASAGKVVR